HGLVGSRDAAEDIVQDVLATVWERADRWAPTGNVATYLFGMVRHHALDVVRRTTREARRHVRVANMLDERDASSPEHELLNAEDRTHAARRLRALDTLLATLTERQRTAYDLRYRQGLTIPEIAQVLGITPKSGEQLLGRLVHTIRERMRALEGGTEGE